MGIAFLGLLRKEIVQFFRDRLILVLILWLYTIEVVICTVALSFDVNHLPLAVVDEDRSAVSRSLIQKFSVSETFDLKFQETRVEKGDAAAVLVIPTGFERDLVAGVGVQLQFLQDGTNSNIAANAVNDALQIVQRQESEVLTPTGKTRGAVPLVRIWYNPELTTSSFMVLSMIALAGMMVGVIHPAASIVREKERGTIEQLLVTPISTLELFLAKITPTLIMGVLSIFPSLVIVRAFDVPLQGSLVLFLVLTAIFLLSAIALGVFIAAYSRTLQQALLLSFFGLFPVMFLSGSLTPVEAMPEFLQSLSLLSPLRYYMDIVIGIFLKGAGLEVLWDEALAMLAIGAPLFLLSLRIFRRRVR